MKVPPFCKGTTRRGDPCRFAARRETGLCINHDPAYRLQQRQNVERATSASLESRAKPAIRIEDLDLSTRAGVQAAIETVLRLELEGRLTERRAKNLMRALSLATRNFDSAAHGRTTHRPEFFRPLRNSLVHRLAALYPETLPEPTE